MYNLPTLRCYQQELRQRIEQTDTQNCIAQLPTGTGKTLVMLDLALSRVSQGQTVLIAVPTLELILNLEYDLKKFAPWIYRNWYCAINSKIGKFVIEKKLYVATYGSIDRYKKLIKPDIIIIDEVHHARAPKFDDLLLYWSRVWQVGFTATPIRFDGKSLKKRFPVLLLSDPISWFIEQGFLSDYDIRVDEHTNSQFSFADNLTLQESIFNKFDLVGDARRNYQVYGAGRKAIVFATGKEHAQNLADQYNEYTPTRCILGDTKERTQWLQDFDNDNHSHCRVLTNVGVITEGVNLKSAKVAQLCRHTGSLSLFLQMCLSLDTEILTIGGFKSYESLTLDDWVAVYDKDGYLDWENPSQIIKRDVNPLESWVCYDSVDLKYKVTDQHDLLVSLGRKSKSYKKVQAWELAEKKYSAITYPIATKYREKQFECKLSNAEIEFIGLFLTDGSLGKQGKYISQVKIYQQSHFKENCQYIERVLNDCGYDYKRYQHNPPSQYNRNSDQYVYTVKKSLIEYLLPYLDKDINILIKRSINVDNIAIFLESLHIGDGSKQLGQYWTRRSYHIATGRKKFADNLQYICITNGYKCNLSEAVNTNGNPIYMLHIKKKDQKITSHGVDDRSRPYTIQSKKDDKCWCVSTNTGTIITRYKGTITIMGNCGRVLRPTNERALILDHAGNVALHGEPKDFIDWQALYDKHEVNIDHFDRDSLFFQCQACDAPIMSLLESKKAKQLVCPQCGYDNFFKPLTPTQLKSLEISNDLLVEYQSVSQSIRFLARVTQSKKMRLPDKIQAIVNCDATREEKKAALLSLEISVDRIDNLYLKA